MAKVDIDDLKKLTKKGKKEAEKRKNQSTRWEKEQAAEKAVAQYLKDVEVAQKNYRWCS